MISPLRGSWAALHTCSHGFGHGLQDAGRPFRARFSAVPRILINAHSGDPSRKNIARIVLNPVFFQESQQFFLKSHFPVMLLLVLDIPSCRFHLRLAYAERSVAGLPGKLATVPQRLFTQPEEFAFAFSMMSAIASVGG